MSRMATAAVCQPLATNPPNKVSRARALVQVGRLRIELGGEGFDSFRGHSDDPR